MCVIISLVFAFIKDSDIDFIFNQFDDLGV